MVFVVDSVNNSVNFGDKNYFSDKILYSSTFENSELGDAPDGTKTIIIHPNGFVRFSVPEQDMQSDSRYLKTVISFEESPAIISTYNSPVFAEFRVGYGTNDIIDSSYVVINRDAEIVPLHSDDTPTDDVVLFKNESILTNRGAYILSLEGTIYNNSDADFIIRGVELYLSADASVWQIAEVIKKEVITSDMIRATTFMSEAMLTQYLRTNIFSLDAMRNVGGGTVNYLTAEDYSLRFYSAELSSTETEQFYIDVTIGGKVERIYYWYAIIGDHEDAYKYLTSIDPRDKYPDISDYERDKFKALVWKQKNTVKKASLEFANVSDGAGGKTTAPVLTMGAGYSDDPNSQLGKMFLYKDGAQGYLKYVTQSGTDTGIIFGESGLTLKGLVNMLEYVTERDDGFDIKFKNDPMFSLRELKDSADNFIGFDIQGVTVPFTKKSGGVGT
jgi:hypothetical protein